MFVICVDSGVTTLSFTINLNVTLFLYLKEHFADLGKKRKILIDRFTDFHNA